MRARALRVCVSFYIIAHDRSHTKPNSSAQYRAVKEHLHTVTQSKRAAASVRPSGSGCVVIPAIQLGHEDTGVLHRPAHTDVAMTWLCHRNETLRYKFIYTVRLLGFFPLPARYKV